MKVTEHFEKAKGKTLFSFEIIPPLKGQSIQSIFNAIDPLMEFKPPFIDVTYHREEYVFKKLPNGLLDRQTTRKRPGTVGICAAIINRYQVDAVPHIICGGFTREETENALIDLSFLGIKNVLALRGDSIKTEPGFVPEPGGHSYAVDLIKQIVSMNQGVYLHEDLQNSSASNFCVGVAAYPEKHFESPNLSQDIAYLKQKIDAGGEYIVTQMFFNNKKFFNFVEKCRAAGINVPIIPGIKPIANREHLTLLPRLFHIDIPEELTEAVLSCKDDKDVRQVGIEWAISQSKELIDYGIPCLHYYTMGRSVGTRKIAEALF
ncbi:MAG: methylenetetrahydrofolate reductase [NAD(P)H] [Cytophagales bacterium]|nr:MAG: methylenetetrahydrofolate reductase [NAD(P)H] [Cytophagales bacterium]TAF61471.1 MAG: methylenetetrahydrofolate reductase [NAD(P)H] [Cytophagales bacterium]